MKLTQNHIMELRKVAKRDWPAGEPRMTWQDRRWAASLLRGKLVELLPGTATKCGDEIVVLTDAGHAALAGAS